MPVLPVDLFRRPIFAPPGRDIGLLLHRADLQVYVTLPILLPVCLHGGLSQIDTGLMMTPWPAIVVIVAPIAGRLSDRYPAGVLGRP